MDANRFRTFLAIVFSLLVLSFFAMIGLAIILPILMGRA